MPDKIRTRLPRLRQFRLNSGAILLSLPAFLVVIALFIYPFLNGILLSFRGGYVGEKGWTLANYQDFFGNSYLSGTIGITFEVALPVTLFSIALSIPLAYYMRRGIRIAMPSPRVCVPTRL